MTILFDSSIDLQNVTETFPSLAKPRLLVSSLDQGDIAVFDGHKFESSVTLSIPAGATRYIRYKMPTTASGKIVGLSNRNFKSLNGEATLDILWNTTGNIDGTSVPIFNQNRNSPLLSEMVINVVTGTTGGLIRESDFLARIGIGSNSSGSISPELGLRLYSPDSDFVAKIVNTHNATNLIQLSYAHIEFHVEDLNL